MLQVKKKKFQEAPWLPKVTCWVQKSIGRKLCVSFPGSWVTWVLAHYLSPVLTMSLRPAIIAQHSTWFLDRPNPFFRGWIDHFIPISNSCLTHVTLAVSRVFLLTRIDWRAFVFYCSCVSQERRFCARSWAGTCDQIMVERKLNKG